MNVAFSQIKSYTVNGRDGPIGSIIDLLIDQDSWNVRYCIIRMTEQDNLRSVLISPISIESVDMKTGVIKVSLSLNQIRSSPQTDLHRSNSSRFEESLVEHYRWPIYWLGKLRNSSNKWGDSQAFHTNQAPLPHLRSVSELGGNLGNEEKFPLHRFKRECVVNTSTWHIEYGTAEAEIFAI